MSGTADKRPDFSVYVETAFDALLPKEAGVASTQLGFPGNFVAALLRELSHLQCRATLQGMTTPVFEYNMCVRQ